MSYAGGLFHLQLRRMKSVAFAPKFLPPSPPTPSVRLRLPQANLPKCPASFRALNYLEPERKEMDRPSFLNKSRGPRKVEKWIELFLGMIQKRLKKKKKAHYLGHFSWMSSRFQDGNPTELIFFIVIITIITMTIFFFFFFKKKVFKCCEESELFT